VVRALAKRDYGSGSPCGAGTGLPPAAARRSARSTRPANLRYPASVEAAMRDSHAAINLVGSWPRAAPRPSRRSRPRARAPWPPRRRRRRRHGPRLRHRRRREFDLALRPRQAAAKKAVLSAMPTATILRPSVVFGPEDQFTNRFAGLAQISPVLPLIGGGLTKLQPVYVGDVAAGSPTPSTARPNPALLTSSRPGMLTCARYGNHPRHRRARAHAGAVTVRTGEAAGDVAAIRAGRSS